MPLPKWIIGLFLLLVGGVSLFALHKENQTLHKELERLSHLVQERPVELATFMAAYERFLGKLYHAGQAQNWALAAFYHEELEETAEQLEKLGISDDGIPVSAMMRPNLIEPLKMVEKAIESRDHVAFHHSMQTLVSHCNSCHAAAGKSYIRFTLPDSSKPPRQVFSKDTDI